MRHCEEHIILRKSSWELLEKVRESQEKTRKELLERTWKLLRKRIHESDGDLFLKEYLSYLTWMLHCSVPSSISDYFLDS